MKERNKSYDNNNIEFYSRIGRLMMTFDDPIDSNQENIHFVATATIFYVDDIQRRAYAITAAHNLVLYNDVDKIMHCLKNMSFQRPVTSDWRISQQYDVDEIWIHPKYDATRLTQEYDLGIVSFRYDDDFCQTSVHRESALNSILSLSAKPIINGYRLVHIIVIMMMPIVAFHVALKIVNKEQAAYYYYYSPHSFCAFIIGIFVYVWWIRFLFQIWESVSIFGYNMNDDQLCGDIKFGSSEQILNSVKRGNSTMFSYEIHATEGQAGSIIVRVSGNGTIKIVGIHTICGAERNCGVILSQENIDWIFNCVACDGLDWDKDTILHLFATQNFFA